MSAGAAFLCQAAGRVWFEVEVVEAKGGALVGFAGTNFRNNSTVGTDALSWSIYSDGKTYHVSPINSLAPAMIHARLHCCRLLLHHAGIAT